MIIVHYHDHDDARNETTERTEELATLHDALEWGLEQHSLHYIERVRAHPAQAYPFSLAVGYTGEGTNETIEFESIMAMLYWAFDIKGNVLCAIL